MNTIKEIKMSGNNFIVTTDNSSLNLNFKKEGKELFIDISGYNLLDATKIAIMCSTYCFIKGFEEKICWLTKDEETKKAINILKLMNTETQTYKKDKERVLLAS